MGGVVVIDPAGQQARAWNKESAMSPLSRPLAGLALGLIATLATPAAMAGTLTTLLHNGSSAWAIQGNIVAYNGSVLATAGGTSSANLLSPIPGGTGWTNTVIHTFNGVGGEGAYPDDGLSWAGGRAYGVTSGGGNAGCANGCGTVFMLTPPAAGGDPWVETQLFKFSNDQNGYLPRSLPLIVGQRVFATATAAANDTTRPGGTAPEGGVAFLLTPKATGGYSYQMLHHFDAASLDGTLPNGAMVRDSAGSIYGETFSGGKCGYGVVYKLTPPAKASQPWGYASLHEFGATASGCDYADGRQPVGGLTLVGNALYGTTSLGTVNECGTVYTITLGATPAYSRIYTFGQTPGDACNVQSRLLVTGTGVIHGASSTGGAGPVSTECTHGCGALFTLTPQTGGGYAAQVDYSFSGGSDGAEPRASLLPWKGGVLSATNHGGQPGDAGNPDYTSFGTLFLFKP